MKIKSWLRWGIIAGVLAVFFIPLLVSNQLFFPFITGKNFAFRILVELIFTLWLLLALVDPSARPEFSFKKKNTWLFLALSLFVVAISIADIFSANPNKSFWSNFERMEGWVGLVHLYMFFVVLWSTFKSTKNWRMLFETGIAVSVLEGLYGLFQLFGKLPINQGGVRVDGTFGNATYLAAYMLFMAFFTALAFYWWGRRGKYLRWWYGCALILQLILIFYTATRGTILGLIGGIFLALGTLLFFGDRSLQVKRWGVAVLVALVVLGGGLYAAKNTTFVQNHEVFSRIASISLAEGQTRFAIWGMAWKGFLERPVFGWGQESFNYVFNTYYEPSMYAQEPWFDRAHNEFIDWLVAGGLVGFLLYISLFILSLWYLWKPHSNFSVPERALFTGLIAAYGFHNMFVFDNLLSYVLFFTLLAYLAFRSADEEEKNKVDASVSPWGKQVPHGAVLVVAPVIVLAMAGVFYFINVPGIATAYSLIEALKPQKLGLATNVRYIKNAAETEGLGRQEAREQLVQFALQAVSSNVADETFRNDAITYAVQKMKEEVALSPNDARLRLFLGGFFRQIGNSEEAKKELEFALGLSPKKQQIIFELGILEMNRGNTLGALELFKSAYDLEPRYDTARIFYASVLIRAGQAALAREILMERFKKGMPDDDILLKAYLDTRDYPSVIAIVKARVDLDPKNVKKLIQLAALYFESGDRMRAITTLQSAIAVDPSFKAQGEYYIQEIAAGRTP